MSFDDRRRALMKKAASKLPTFTGSYSMHGDMAKGYIKLLSSGTLVLPPNTYDFFLCGAGGKGGKGTQNSASGGGGGGGYVTTKKGVLLSKYYEYDVIIDKASDTVLGNLTAKKGGDGSTSAAGTGGKSGGAPVNASGNGNAGTQGVYPFGSSAFENYRYGAGGGSGAWGNTWNTSETSHSGGAGGKSGGGAGGGVDSEIYFTEAKAGVANSGGGGGGSTGGSVGTVVGRSREGKDGGSGVAFVRWGY